jgi:hypothetical protein
MLSDSRDGGRQRVLQVQKADRLVLDNAEADPQLRSIYSRKANLPASAK